MSTLRRIMLGSGEIDLSKIPENRKVYYEAVEKLTARPFTLIANKYDFNTKEGILVSSKDIITLPDSAFNGQTGLKKIILPSSVTTIGSNAFKGCTLDELVLQSPFLEANFVRNVTSWGTISYNNYWNTGATINKLVLKGYNTADENLKLNVGEYVFASSNVKTVEIADSVNGAIGKGAFEYSKLEKIIIGDGITTFGNDAFFGTDYLKTLVVKCDLSNCTVGSSVFGFCSKNSGGLLSLYLYNNTLANYLNAAWLSFGKEYTLEKNIYINDELLKNVIVPLDVTEIKYGPLINSPIESIEIHDFVTSIENRAFNNCTKLNSVKIGKGVSNIGEDVFLGVSGEITIDSNIIGNDFSYDTAVNNSFLKGSNFTTVNIGNNVTKIGKEAFAYLDLENVILGNGLVEIDKQAFHDCAKLTNVNIGDSVTTIGDYAFYNCESLTNINIPESVTSIGSTAFCNCTNLTSITIPDSVTEIGDSAFRLCYNLTSVYCKATTPPALGGTRVFDENGSDRKIYVPAGSVEAYKSAEYWSEYADAIVGYDFENNTVIE